MKNRYVPAEYVHNYQNVLRRLWKMTATDGDEKVTHKINAMSHLLQMSNDSHCCMNRAFTKAKETTC